MNGTWAEPGLNTLPQVPASTAQAAMIGLTPAPIRVGIMIAPTAAPQPAALGRAILIRNVTMTVPGIKMTRNRPSAPASRCTKWASHLVNFMTKAKPMTVQMTVTRPGLTIALLNASTAAIGLPDAAAMATPDTNRTNLVSYFLMIAANVNTTMIAPTQIKEIPPKIIVILSIRDTLSFFLRRRTKKGSKERGAPPDTFSHSILPTAHLA